MGGVGDDEDGGGRSVWAEAGGELQGLFAGIAAAGKDGSAVGGDAAQLQFIEIGAGGFGSGGVEGHGDEDGGVGVEGGGCGCVIGAHEGGFAGDAAAAHEEEDVGFVMGRVGEGGEAFVCAPRPIRKQGGGGKENQEADGGQGPAEKDQDGDDEVFHANGCDMEGSRVRSATGEKIERAAEEDKAGSAGQDGWAGAGRKEVWRGHKGGKRSTPSAAGRGAEGRGSRRINGWGGDYSSSSP